MSTPQQLIDRIAVTLAHPADDPFTTMLVVLIVIAAAVMIALALIAFALPSRRTESDTSAPEDAIDATGSTIAGDETAE